jgi:hypothetical protein
MSFSWLFARRVLPHLWTTARANGITWRANVNSTGPATRSGESGVRLPVPLGLVLGFWRHLRSRSRPPKPTLDALSDHLLTDVGLDGPGYGQASWERYIHR